MRWRRESAGSRSCVPRTACNWAMGWGPFVRREAVSSRAGSPGQGTGLFGGFGRLRRFDLGGLPLDQMDQMIDDIRVLQAMVRLAGDIDLMRAIAAAGE